ncbi:MAG: alkaline phosphatase family protein [Actinomycetota bacterium]|nr:alkaline phosphatase family protein [Actinomycetota bacterium]
MRRRDPLLPFAPMAFAALVGAVLLVTQPSAREPVSESRQPQALTEPGTQPAPVVVKGRRSARQSAQVPIPKKRYLRDACKLPPRWIRYIDRGWAPGPTRSRDIVLVPRPPSYVGTFLNTSHSGPYDFLQRVPLVFYGPGLIEPQGQLSIDREVTLADLAPTHAAMLGFNFGDRQGRPIHEVLTDDAQPPRLLVTVSIDGGGWNVLNGRPDSWPYLARLIERGSNIKKASVGSSPSITPAIHTTMSTGNFPQVHGVTGIGIRNGDELVGAFSYDGNYSGVPVEPRLNLRSKTLADKWDAANANRAKAALIASGNYPLGLLGHGASMATGDKDLALIAEPSGDWTTDRRYYSMPRWATAITGRKRDRQMMDRADGTADGSWRGHDIATTQTGFTPADAAWVARTATTLLDEEGFGKDSIADLLYVHFKSPDHVGHRWNMNSREMGDVLTSVDDGLKTLVTWLDANIGYGGYLLTVTADHGQTPLGEGGWAINRAELLDDVRERFDHVDDDLGIIERSSATSLFLSVEEMRANGVSPEEISSYLSRYRIGDNLPEGVTAPAAFDNRLNQRLFSAVFPGRSLPLITRCAEAG